MSNRHKQHENYKNDWATPWDVFNEVEEWLIAKGLPRFYLDVAASDNNFKVADYFTKKDDALKQSWKNKGFWWANPPFKMVEHFLDKATEELRAGNQGVMLVPNGAETKWFRRCITYANRPRIMWPKRIAYLNPETGKPVSGNVTGTWFVLFVTPSNAVRLTEPPWLKGEPCIANLFTPPPF